MLEEKAKLSMKTTLLMRNSNLESEMLVVSFLFIYVIHS